MAKVPNQDEIYAAYTLGCLPSIGRVKANRIWHDDELRDEYVHCFSISFRKKTDWAKPIPDKEIAEVLQTSEKCLKDYENNGCDALLISDPFYPSGIGQIADAPLVLFCKGEQRNFNYKNISVVGTRSPSTYGKQNAEISAQFFAENGINVVSGFAYGIDILAHMATIKAGGSTTAVLGSGLGNIYPKQHKKYVDAVLEHGCFLSELPFNEEPYRENFPKRNRLVAALSKATLVVESKHNGGSLITAKLAFDYNKEVFAYPGEILNENYSGNHVLVQRQLAQLATSPQYILRQLSWDEKDKKSKKHPPTEIAEHLKTVYQSIVNSKNCDIHSLAEYHNTSFSDLQLKLTELELMGLIKVLPGNAFIAT